MCMTNILYRMIYKCSEANKPAIKYKVIAVYCVETGIRIEKAKEYLQLLEDSNKIIEKEDGLWIVQKNSEQ